MSIDLIRRFLDRPIAFHRCLVKPSGSVEAALLLSQALYWSNRTEDPDGWFYKTREEWEEETGLNRTSQEAARKRLKENGLLEEERRGLPARLYYRVNFEKLVAKLLGPGEEADPAEVTERTLSIYERELLSISKTAYERAVEAGVHAERVDYAEILKRDNSICYLCKKVIPYGPGQKPDQLQFDHVVAIVNGGPHQADNVFCAHAKCNLSRRHDRRPTSPTSWLAIDQLDGSRLTNRLACDTPTINKEAETTTESTTETTSSPSSPSSKAPPPNSAPREKSPEAAGVEAADFQLVPAPVAAVSTTKVKANGPPPKDVLARCEAVLGYQLALPAREAACVRALRRDWTDDQIIACLKWLTTDPWWADKPLSLTTVQKQIAFWHSKGEPSERVSTPQSGANSGKRRGGRPTATPEHLEAFQTQLREDYPHWAFEQRQLEAARKGLLPGDPDWPTE